MKRYFAQIGFAVLFIANTYFLSLHYESLLSAPLILMVAFPLATFRVARAISFNAIFEWLREPFSNTVSDSSGAGKSTNPTNILGDLLCCPICAGTWAAEILADLYVIVPGFGTVFVLVLAFAGVSELFHWWSEAQEWAGRASREEAGTAWLVKHGVQLSKAASYLEEQDARESAVTEHGVRPEQVRSSGRDGALEF